MKKFIMVFAVLVIYGTLFAAAKFITADVTDYGFTVQIPSDWSFKMLKEDNFNQATIEVPAGEEEYITCYFAPLKGDYTKAKSDLPASFRSENFKSFDEMYGPENLKIKVTQKAKCSKINGIEVCAAEFKYDYQQYPNQLTYFAIFKTDKGAYQAFYSAEAKVYKKTFPKFKKVMASLKLIK